MKTRLINRRFAESSYLLMVLCLICVSSTKGQETRAPQLPAPPPMRVVSSADRVQLDAVRDPKARVRRSVELADAHLQRAEESASQQKFTGVLVELGNYLGLIEDAFTFLADTNRDNSKMRDHYKRIELALRADGPRLDALRRITPLEYAVRVKEAEEFARAGRTEALNSFYGHTVVRETREKKPDNNKPKD